MSAIKELISVFCKVIGHFNFSPLSAEDFRQAKFNNKSVLEKMWMLLHELLVLLNRPSVPGNQEKSPGVFLIELNLTNIRNIFFI